MNSTSAVAPNASVGRTLLVSSDAATVQQLSEAMQQLALYPEVCLEVPIALRLLNNQKFEAVIVDLLLGESAHAILEEARTSRSNRRAVIFTISGNPTGTAGAFRAGSSFVLERPLSMASISRMLKAAYGLIVRERRRYFRCPLAVPVDVRRQGMNDIRGQTLNTSEGGMAMMMPLPLKSGQLVGVHFQLPDRPFQFAVQSFICWSDEQGRVGLQFASPSGEWKAELQAWLSQRLEDSLPESVAEKFRRAIKSTHE